MKVLTKYLFKEQAYRGRCNVLKKHKREIIDLIKQTASCINGIHKRPINI